MKFNREWLFNVFREEANPDGGDGGSTTVLTDASADNGSEDTSPPAAVEESETNVDDTGGNADDKTDLSNQTPPDTYADFTMPEGVEVDSTMLEEAVPVFKELGLNQAQAQKLIDLQAKYVQASSQSQVDAFNQLMNDWQEQAKNDKEFGGDKFEENVGIARSAVEKFGTPELKQLLEEHGVGNHPEVIRFMVKVGKLTAEDVPGNSNSPSAGNKDRAEVLYGK